MSLNHNCTLIKTMLYIKEEKKKKIKKKKKKKKKKKIIHEESIVHPLIEFEPNYNRKHDLFFLSNNRFIEVLNCVQFTAVCSLF